MTNILDTVADKHKELRDKEFVPVTHYGLDTLFENFIEDLKAEILNKFPEAKDNRPDTSQWNKAVSYVVTSIMGDIDGRYK